MKNRLLSLIPAVLLTAPLASGLAACGEDDRVGHGDDKAGGAPQRTFELTKDLGCGFGFARADDAGETLLTVYHQPGGGKVDATVTLPDPGWSAQVEVGTHLDANWCTDVIVDPQAEVDETWEVVGGTLVFEGAVPKFDGSENEQPVRARLTSAVVENEEGEQVELGDVPLSNSSFGFLAG